jgi:hypothetical protein
MPGDILDDFNAARRSPRYPVIDAQPGLVVEDRASGFCGDVVAVDARAVTLRDRHDKRREFRLHDGAFLLDGRPVSLRRPPVGAPQGVATRSGSIATATPPRARVAAASRLWVEGRHDAELLEHVWGDDLRELAVVVEPLHGIDHLALRVAEFEPGPHRRLGVLVDHLVPGSKEARLAAEVSHPHVLVCGHPFVDVWEGIRPQLVGLQQWPSVPRTMPWKQGMCAALGTDVSSFWPRLRNRVSTFADLRPELVGAVEQLLDFVTDGG